MTVRPAIDADTLSAVQNFAARIRSNYPIKQILLYGSRARGDHQPDSDADVAVILGGQKQRTVTVAMQMSDPAWETMLESGIFISSFPVWQEDWDNPSNAANPWLIENIKREGIPF